MTLSRKILAFQKSLRISAALPNDVEVLNPYQDQSARALCEQFYDKFYDDLRPRTLILGINPGRFGGGITGIPFTDPVKLEKHCGVKNSLPKKAELSADFIYAMISAYGGPLKFYHKYYISAVSPLGFTRNGKNMNYYDDRALQDSLDSFIITSLQSQLKWGLNQEVCFCLGEGQNLKFLMHLNNKNKFFRKIVPLTHPRFIMQYRRKQVDHYIRDYINTLN